MDYADINERLIRHLQDENEIPIVSLAFSTLETNEKRVAFLYDLLEERDMLPRLAIDGKSGKKSEEYRKKGNELFKLRKSREAHEFYTKSVACAEMFSENLALAFANRSAVLFENGLYKECLMDIDQALKYKYPENLQPKLLARQSKANDLLSTQTPISFFTPVPSIPFENRNSKIQCASDSIKIENSEVAGRHIVATKDIEPGEVVAIEEPFCQILIEQFFIHCHHCLNLCYTLIPCPDCTQTLYCSDKCQNEAKAYHQYECPILLTVKRMELDKLKLLPLKLAILTRDKYDTLDKCVLDEDGTYRSDRYHEIHNLVPNTSSRSVSDLFNRAITAAVIFHLIKSNTKFFNDNNVMVQEIFKELLLLHMQTGPCNFHEITAIKSSDKVLEQQEIGAGAFSFLSMFNHACCPNIARYAYGSTTIAIAIESIKKGEQCFDNYGYHHAIMPKSERQAKLKNQYFFACTCTACEKDYPMYRSLPVIKMTDEVIPNEELKYLLDYNLEEAKKILKKTFEKIKQFEKNKPNKNLAELQEVLKQCYFIFRTIKTPI